MLDKYYAINQVTGISITLGQGGNIEADVCEILVNDKQLNITKRSVDLTTVEELRKNVSPGSLISLNLNGKGILQKKINRVENVDEAIFNSFLPNANWNDFYIQNFISGENSFVTVIRKAEADKWIDQLNALGVKVLLLSLGAYPVNNILSQLNLYGEEITFDGHIILRNEQQEWISYNFDEKAKSAFALKIESELLDEKLLIAYSAAFEVALSHKLELINAPISGLSVALKSHLDNKKVKVQGFMALVVLFVLLLVNFLLFSSYNSDNVVLAENLSRSAQSTSDVEQINNEVRAKENLLKAIGWEGEVNKSIYIDQLAALLPSEISWKIAALDPINLATSRVQKSITFYSRTISITGTSEKIVPVNEWIARIKTKPWVKTVQLNNYVFNSELNTGQFTLFINY